MKSLERGITVLDIQSLNLQQKEAVLDEHQYLRIIAGAGSGKTRVLTMKIAHLIADKQVWPTKILAITFTNKAAREMENRIFKMLTEDISKPIICTIHSLCVRILRQDIGVMNYPRNFTILDAEDQKAIIKEFYKEHHLHKEDLSFSAVLNYISNNKAVNLTVDEAYKIADFSDYEKLKAKIYEYYLQRQKELLALDFDDLIIWTVNIFQQFATIKQKWQSYFKYILVDEFQDIDHIQYKLIKLLVGKDNNLLVVGDPDQTIYTWRGADVRIIVDFAKDFPQSRTILLTQNYRSTKAILQGANSVIKNNKQRVDKDLFTIDQSPDKIYHFSASSDESQALWIAHKMKSICAKKGSYAEIAVLYRANYLSRSLEKALMDERIPYVIYGGLRFFERQIVKDVLSYMRLVLKGDDLSFDRIINRPKRGIGIKTIDQISQRAKELNCTKLEVLKQESLFKGKVQMTIDSFLQSLNNWQERIKQADISLLQAFEMVIDESGYQAFLASENDADNLGYLKSLLEDVQDFEKRYPQAHLEEYLQSVALYGDRTEIIDNNYVQLMTIHAAKGLEFNTVFISDLNEGIFPSERSISEGNKGLEEERRLAYVAFTRARQHLYLTDASGYSYILQKAKMPSRFITEIADEYITHQISGVKKENMMPPLFVSKNVQSLVKNKVWHKKEVVMHIKFGEGVVISQDGDFVTIAFAYPWGIKKLQANHPSLKKK